MFDLLAFGFPMARDLLQQLTGVSDEEMREIENRAQSQAFWMAGITDKQIAQDALDAVETTRDLPAQEWRLAMEDELEKAWGTAAATGNSAARQLATWEAMRRRTNLIFVNWTQSAHNEAHWNEINSPEELEERPYFQFSALDDARTSPICKRCDDTILPADHPWWNTHRPQLHHGCRSTILSITARKARRLGITADPYDGQDPKIQVGKGFGEGREWKPKKGEIDPRLNPEPRPE